MSIYRQYEDPRALEAQRDALKGRIERDRIEAEQEGREVNYELYNELLELEERINFAWQDEEYEEDCRRNESYYSEEYCNQSSSEEHCEESNEEYEEEYDDDFEL